MTGTVDAMEAMKDLGQRIKTERIAQGYSVKTAAEASGIARDTWRKIEAGASVQDTKRHIAMEFLGLSEANTEWGTVGRLEDHAADFSGQVDLNVMFSQAVRFTSTLGLLVPEVRPEAERQTLALSELYSQALRMWDRKLPEDRWDGGDGHDDDDLGGTASTSQMKAARKTGLLTQAERDQALEFHERLVEHESSDQQGDSA